MTVDDIFKIDPSTGKVLKKFQLTQFLGQQIEFEEACYRNEICSKTVKKELLQLYHRGHPHFDMSTWSPDQVVNSLQQRQHALVKKLLKKIKTTLDQVIDQYGSNRIELNKIKTSFDEVKEELERHMYTEEVMIFPAIQNIVNRSQTHEEKKLFRLLYPIEVMKAEHEKIFRSMKEIKKTSRNFKVPKNVNQSFNTLYQQLQTLESILINTLTIENNILYPAVLQLEEKNARYR